MLAKSNGLEEECQNILEASGLTEEEISLPTIGKPANPPKAVAPTFKANWPVKASGASSFEKALLADGDEAVVHPCDDDRCTRVLWSKGGGVCEKVRERCRQVGDLPGMWSLFGIRAAAEIGEGSDGVLLGQVEIQSAVLMARSVTDP